MIKKISGCCILFLIITIMAISAVSLNTMEAEECCCDLSDWDCGYQAESVCCSIPQGTGDIFVTEQWGCCWDYGICLSFLHFECDVIYGTPVKSAIICDCICATCYY